LLCDYRINVSNKIIRIRLKSFVLLPVFEIPLLADSCRAPPDYEIAAFEGEEDAQWLSEDLLTLCPLRAFIGSQMPRPSE